ncbi:hypothetical protein C8Q77DRAFT_867287 [Trametes polyzona]|nr:hypothetical protein C8Q77DRAFT_867287 [Trametes polyzona]
MGVGRAVDEDPLARLLAPPPNETAEEREIRLRLEAEARARSERIDEQLKAEKAALKKNKPVKVLLLGQSESGKSTTLKSEYHPICVVLVPYYPDAWVIRTSWLLLRTPSLALSKTSAVAEGGRSHDHLAANPDILSASTCTVLRRIPLSLSLRVFRTAPARGLMVWKLASLGGTRMRGLTGATCIAAASRGWRTYNVFCIGCRAPHTAPWALRPLRNTFIASPFEFELHEISHDAGYSASNVK